MLSLFFLSFLATQSGLQDLRSPTRDRTHVFCSGSTESYPLNHQGNPSYHLQSVILFSGWNWVAILSAFQHAGRKKSKSCMRDFIFKKVTRGSMHHLPLFMSHFKEGWQMESLAWWPCARLQFESFIVQDQEWQKQEKHQGNEYTQPSIPAGSTSMDSTKQG